MLYTAREIICHISFAFYFYFFVLAGRSKFSISEFHCGNEDVISSFILFDTAFPDLMSEMLVYKKVTRQGNMGYLGFFSGTPKSEPN